jgi:hypothetical protein
MAETRQPDAYDEDGSPLYEITPPNIDEVMARKEPLDYESAKRLVEHFRAKRNNWNVKKAKERKRKEAA